MTNIFTDFCSKNISDISKYKDNVHEINKNGNNLLMIAINHRFDIEIIEKLIDYGSNINIKNHKNMTPLLLAITSTNHDLVELLLIKGADPNLENPLTLAMYKQYFDITELLINNGADIYKPILFKILFMKWTNKDDKSYIFELMLNCGADDSLESLFPEVLHYIDDEIYFDKSDIFTRLKNNLQHILEYMLADKTPLATAIYNGQIGFAKYLISIGAEWSDINSVTKATLYLEHNNTDKYNEIIEYFASL